MTYAPNADDFLVSDHDEYYCCSDCDGTEFGGEDDYTDYDYEYDYDFYRGSEADDYDGEYYA